MPFQNLNINQLIIHEIFKRNNDRTIREPRYGEGLISLDVEAKDALQQRITDALGKSSHGLEMTIKSTSDEGMWNQAKQIIEAQNDETIFINASQNIAAKLVEAQTTKTVPGGIVVVISGTSGNPSRSFICVIKAEPHAGFIKRDDNGQLLLEYLQELILTPQAKLYKIGAFVFSDPSSTIQEKTAGWQAFLFDDQMTKSNRLGAAQYFYETFLGLTFPSNSAFQTKNFHTFTKEFIRQAKIDQEKKSDLLNALTTYLKTEQTATIQVAEFSNTYLDTPELKDSYTQHMVKKSFPQNAIHKDLAEVALALQNRKIFFGHNIKLTAPTKDFDDYVSIKSIDGEPDANGQIPKWTQITVRESIRDQE